MNNARHEPGCVGLLPAVTLLLLTLLLGGCASQTTSSSHGVWTPYGGYQSSSFIQEEVFYLGPYYYPYAYGPPCRPCKGWHGRKGPGWNHYGSHGRGRSASQGLNSSPGSGLRAVPSR